jgi:hypothetical protein
MLFVSAVPGEDQSAPQAPNAASSSAPARPVERGPHASVEQRIDQRVRTLARALNLNVDQQGQVRMILVDQVQRLQKILRDPSLAADDRIGALRAMNQGTTERIRSVLDEEQKKKYNPLPAHPAASDPNAVGGSPSPAQSPSKTEGARP